MRKEIANIIEEWLTQAKEEIANGCTQEGYVEIPFNSESLDKIEMLLDHALTVFKTEVKDEDNTRDC